MKPVYFVTKMMTAVDGKTIVRSSQEIIDILTDKDIIAKAEEHNIPRRTISEIILEAEREQKRKRWRTTISEMPRAYT